MHFDLSNIILLAATGIGSWLFHRFIHTPRDAERAAIVKEIAYAAASLVVSLYPDKDWPTLLKLVVEQIGKAAGLPVNDAGVIERAAAAALTSLGKNPGVKPAP